MKERLEFLQKSGEMCLLFKFELTPVFESQLTIRPMLMNLFLKQKGKMQIPKVFFLLENGKQQSALSVIDVGITGEYAK